MLPTTTCPDQPYVLLVDDDNLTAEFFTWALQLRHIQVASARNGFDGIQAARRRSFDLLLLDLRLPDMLGLDVVRTLHAQGVHVPFMVLSGYVTVPVAVEAMRLGALTVLEKPLDIAQLADVVRIARSTGAPRATARSPEPAPLSWRAPIDPRPRASSMRARSIAERWAALVMGVIDSACDPKTLEDWARAVSVSRSTLCECCRLVHVSPHDARDFARMMRAVAHCGHRWLPEAVMDVADARTLTKLLRRSGMLGVTVTPMLDDFLDRQALIPNDNPGLAALRMLIAGDRRSSASA
jgi:ActR/RegA family two-component response regulator